MSKIAVVYWSGTGNTEMMANAVVKGAEDKGAEAQLFKAADFNGDMLNDFDAVAFGCPAMGADELEETEFAPMFESCKDKLWGKPTALFGSYGWSGGKWMEDWMNTCRGLSANLVHGGVICCGLPDTEAVNECIDLGRALAAEQ